MMVSLSVHFEQWFSTWSWTLGPLSAEEEESVEDEELFDEEVDNDDVAPESDLRADHVIADPRAGDLHARIGFRT